MNGAAAEAGIGTVYPMRGSLLSRIGVAGRRSVGSSLSVVGNVPRLRAPRI